MSGQEVTEGVTDSERIELLQEFLVSESADQGNSSKPGVAPEQPEDGENSPQPYANEGDLSPEMLYALHAQEQFRALADHESPPAPYPYTDPYAYSPYAGYPPYPYQQPYPPQFAGYMQPPPPQGYYYQQPPLQQPPSQPLPRTRSQESVPQTLSEAAKIALSADSGDEADGVVVEGEEAVMHEIDEITPSGAATVDDHTIQQQQYVNQQYPPEQYPPYPYPYPVDPSQMQYMYPYPPIGPDGQPLPPMQYPHPYPYPYGYPPGAYPPHPQSAMPPHQVVYTDYDKAKKAIAPDLDQVLEAIEIRHDRVNVDTMTEEIKYELDCELYVALGYFFQSEEGTDIQESDPKLYHQLEEEYDRVLKVYYKGQGHETSEGMVCCSIS